jgi:hypothetical protein
MRRTAEEERKSPTARERLSGACDVPWRAVSCPPPVARLSDLIFNNPRDDRETTGDGQTNLCGEFI